MAALTIKFNYVRDYAVFDSAQNMNEAIELHKKS